MLKYLTEMLEIIGERLIQTDVVDRKYNGQFDFNRLRTMKRTDIGHGAFAKVVPDNKNPHSVIKKSKVPVGQNNLFKRDGFKTFTDLLGIGDVADNIHFPRVYKVDTITDRNKTQRYEFDIERLVPLSSMSRKEFEAIATANFEPAPKNVEAMAGIVDMACAHLDTSKIKSESLAKACNTLGRYARDYDVGLDLHSDNLMVRRTPYGNVLIINDPFLNETTTGKEEY